jgi:quercetin dioxygenase-like cupin family protein
MSTSLHLLCAYIVVILITPAVSGRAIHVLEDGSEQEVGPGDTVVQRGTHHRWENRTNDWARWISVLIYANPVVVNGKELGPLVE